MAKLGTNIEISVKDNKATIVIDLTQTHGETSSGKSIKVASTEGNQTIPGSEIKIGLNAYKPKAR